MNELICTIRIVLPDTDLGSITSEPIKVPVLQDVSLKYPSYDHNLLEVWKHALEVYLQEVADTQISKLLKVFLYNTTRFGLYVLCPTRCRLVRIQTPAAWNALLDVIATFRVNVKQFGLQYLDPSVCPRIPMFLTPLNLATHEVQQEVVRIAMGDHFQMMHCLAHQSQMRLQHYFVDQMPHFLRQLTHPEEESKDFYPVTITFPSGCFRGGLYDDDDQTKVVSYTPVHVETVLRHQSAFRLDHLLMPTRPNMWWKEVQTIDYAETTLFVLKDGMMILVGVKCDHNSSLPFSQLATLVQSNKKNIEVVIYSIAFLSPPEKELASGSRNVVRALSNFLDFHVCAPTALLICPLWSQKKFEIWGKLGCPKKHAPAFELDGLLSNGRFRSQLSSSSLCEVHDEEKKQSTCTCPGAFQIETNTPVRSCEHDEHKPFAPYSILPLKYGGEELCNEYNHCALCALISSQLISEMDLFVSLQFVSSCRQCQEGGQGPESINCFSRSSWDGQKHRLPLCVNCFTRNFQDVYRQRFSIWVDAPLISSMALEDVYEHLDLWKPVSKKRRRRKNKSSPKPEDAEHKELDEELLLKEQKRKEEAEQKRLLLEEQKRKKQEELLLKEQKRKEEAEQKRLLLEEQKRKEEAEQKRLLLEEQKRKEEAEQKRKKEEERKEEERLVMEELRKECKLKFARALKEYDNPETKQQFLDTLQKAPLEERRRIMQEIRKEREEEELRIYNEEMERRRLRAEEAERERRQKREEQRKRRKEEAEQKRKEEEEERKRKEEEERKRKEEEERKRKEEEERKRKEEEQRRKEEEEQKRQLAEQQRKEEEQKRQLEQRQVPHHNPFLFYPTGHPGWSPLMSNVLQQQPVQFQPLPIPPHCAPVTNMVTLVFETDGRLSILPHYYHYPSGQTIHPQVQINQF